MNNIFITSKIVPYVYLLIHKEDKRFYIGSRRANKYPPEIDLPKYKTSSKYVKEIGFENFDYFILVTFPFEDGKLDALKTEQLLIQENWSDPLIINKSVFVGDTINIKRSGKNKNKIKKFWWNDGTNNLKSVEQPGENFVKGFLKSIQDKRCYNNGTECKLFYDGKEPEDWVYGKLEGNKWWTNGIININSVEKPDEDFYEGKINYRTTEKTINDGEIWWNNGSINVRNVICPGKNFIRGRIDDNRSEEKLFTGRQCWNNGIENNYAFECPGEGWTHGLLKNIKGKKFYNNGKDCKMFIEGQQYEGWILGKLKRT